MVVAVPRRRGSSITVLTKFEEKKRGLVEGEERKGLDGKVKAGGDVKKEEEKEAGVSVQCLERVEHEEKDGGGGGGGGRTKLTFFRTLSTLQIKRLGRKNSLQRMQLGKV